MEQSNLLTGESAHRFPPHPVGTLVNPHGLNIWHIVQIVEQAARQRNERRPGNDPLDARVAHFLELATDEERELYNRLALG
jgi:hypothetical protein